MINKPVLPHMDPSEIEKAIEYYDSLQQVYKSKDSLIASHFGMFGRQADCPECEQEGWIDEQDYICSKCRNA